MPKIVLNLCPSTYYENIKVCRRPGFPAFRPSESSFSWTPSCPAEWVDTFHGHLYCGSERRQLLRHLPALRNSQPQGCVSSRWQPPSFGHPLWHCRPCLGPAIQDLIWHKSVQLVTLSGRPWWGRAGAAPCKVRGCPVWRRWAMGERLSQLSQPSVSMTGCWEARKKQIRWKPCGCSDRADVALELTWITFIQCSYLLWMVWHAFLGWGNAPKVRRNTTQICTPEKWSCYLCFLPVCSLWMAPWFSLLLPQDRFD